MTNRIFASKEDAKEFLYSKFGKDESFDVCIKDVYVKKLPVLCVYISGLVDGSTLTDQLAPLYFDSDDNGQVPAEDINDDTYFDNTFNFYGKSEPKDKEEFLLGVLSGQVGFVTLHGFAYLLELRNYPGRQPEEPDNEKVIRGSRDGFAENIMINTALIRRRIRSPELRFEMHKITSNGRTDVAIAYIKDIVNDQHLKWVKQRIEEIKHDGLTMADKTLEEWIFKQSSIRCLLFDILRDRTSLLPTSLKAISPSLLILPHPSFCCRLQYST